MNTNKRLSALLAAVLISLGTAAPMTAIAADSAPAASAAASVANVTPLPPPLPAAVSKEAVDNPYGLDALWKGGDFVARGTLIILVLMSMGSWYVTITKLLD